MRRCRRGDSTSVSDWLSRVNSKRAVWRHFVLAATALLLSSRPAGADQRADQVDYRDARTAESDQKPPKRKKDTPEFRWDEHPSLVFSKGTRIDFKALFQGDLQSSQAPLDGEEGIQGLDVGRRRVGVEGRIANVVDFQVEAELRLDEPWRDVYANYRRYERVQVQAGQFKLPFSLDENTAARNLDFVYRSMAASRLSPGRDRGVMAHGRLLDRRVRYEAGVFNHDGRNARTGNPERIAGGATFAGRVTTQPFRGKKTAFTDLQLGVALTASAVDEGVIGLRARTVLGSSFFAPDLFLDGTRTRVGVEGRWRRGPASIKAEYIGLASARDGQSVENMDLSPFHASGWYLSGTYVLTGESKADGLDVPRRPLPRGGPGAIELAARLEGLAFGTTGENPDASTSPRAEIVRGNGDRALTLGVNWHPSRWIKVQANLVYETLTDAAAGPLPAKRSFWSRLLRLQLAL
jgi:phosphate-selective porin OprO and OprP